MNPDPCHREQIYLALLCQHSSTAPLRAELERRLSLHSWNVADHRVVFEALAGWRAEPSTIRDGLAARLTRRGFPDVDIAEYFAPVAVSLETALLWLREDNASGPISPSPAPIRAAQSK